MAVAASQFGLRVDDLTTQELSMVLLVKLPNATHVWGASREEMLEIAEGNGITVLDDREVRELWPAGRPRADAAAAHRARAAEAEMTARFERARFARAQSRTTLPSVFLVGQLVVLLGLMVARQRYGSLTAARQTAIQWLGMAAPPCPPPTWFQSMTPWLDHYDPELPHCSA